MPEDLTQLTPQQLIVRILASDSRDEIHAIASAWLRANPTPPTMDSILARVDSMLVGWYRSPEGYDPRVVGPILDELAAIPARIVRESGHFAGFDARAWLEAWAHEPHPALGGHAPVRVLHTAEGLSRVRQLLEQQQSGAYI